MFLATLFVFLINYTVSVNTSFTALYANSFNDTLKTELDALTEKVANLEAKLKEEQQLLESTIKIQEGVK